MRKLIQAGGAVVTLGRTWDGADRVSYYREETANILLDHLYELGHRRIGLVLGVAREGMAQECLDAYQHFVAKHSLVSMIEHCGPTVPDSTEATNLLLQRQPRPTAIVSVNDYLAMGVYRSLGMHGLRIPDDVSVAGFDNTHVADNLYPTLTSVGHPCSLSWRVAQIQNVRSKSSRCPPASSPVIRPPRRQVMHKE